MWTHNVVLYTRYSRELPHPRVLEFLALECRPEISHNDDLALALTRDRSRRRERMQANDKKTVGRERGIQEAE